MTITTESAKKLMTRCKTGCRGDHALDDAHDMLAECYTVIGALILERDELRARDDYFDDYLSDNGHVRR